MQTPTAMTALALSLSLLLAACDTSGVPKDNNLALRPGSNAATFQRAQVTVTAPPGTWTVSGAAPWIQVTQRADSGRAAFTFTADAQAAIPPTANLSAVTDTVTISGPAGRYDLTLTLPLTALQGQVPVTAAPTAALSPLAEPDAQVPHAPGRILVVYRGAPSAALTVQGARPVRQLRTGQEITHVLDVPDMAAALAHYRRDARVRTAIRDVRLHAQATFTPGDPYAGAQWALPKIGYADVLADHPEQYPNAVTVAVVDSGVRAEHEDLQGRVYGPQDGAADLITDPGNGDGDGPDRNPTDPGVSGGTSHGTAVTGVLAANQNAVGVAGGTLNAPVRVLPVRVLGNAGDGDTSEVLLGLRYAAGESVTVGGVTYTNPHPAQVINLSVGASGDAFTAEEKAFICEAVTAAAQRGALIVAAAGNSGRADAQYPGACADALAVAAVTLDAQGNWAHAPYSATGPHVALSAPGGSLDTTYNGATVGGTRAPDGILSPSWRTGAATGTYAFEQGTSFATPMVSAVAALMFSKGVVTTAAQAKARLLATATDVLTPGKDNQTGAGVLNASAALSLSGTTPPPTAALVTIQNADRTRTWQPPVQSSGAWRAYLSGGTYHVRSGRDTNGNLTLDDSEVTQARDVTLQDGEAQVLP